MKSHLLRLAALLALNPALLSAADDGWIDLLSGGELDAWRGFKKETVPGNWTLQDGVLTCDGKGGPDLITREKFGDFELKLEWKAGLRANSGILILADESPGAIWHHAPEIQVFNAKPGATNYIQQAGAVYDLYPAIPESLKPAGEWNQVVVRFEDQTLTITHNGTQVCSVEVGGEDWNERVAKSKFAKHAGFAKNAEGHIGLQEHGSVVHYRNILVRHLKN